MNFVEKQAAICRRHGAEFLVSPGHLKAGVARNLGLVPLHGLRHPATEDTTGWYIWSGEFSEAPDFFEPVHVGHLMEICRDVVPYLGLAPGWRFLVAPGHVDVWFDKTLLDV